jgi:hypothetical protein
MFDSAIRPMTTSNEREALLMGSASSCRYLEISFRSIPRLIPLTFILLTWNEPMDDAELIVFWIFRQT